jgi:hypothetical protein
MNQDIHPDGCLKVIDYDNGITNMSEICPRSVDGRISRPRANYSSDFGTPTSASKEKIYTIGESYKLKKLHKFLNPHRPPSGKFSIFGKWSGNADHWKEKLRLGDTERFEAGKLEVQIDIEAQLELERLELERLRAQEESLN